jgi:hypothetical protein
MDALVLENIPFSVDLDRLAKKLHVREGSGLLEDLRQMVRDAEAVANPKSLSRVAYVDSKGDDTVVIDEIIFKSRVLRVNVDQAHRVFPYVSTCGRELEQWSKSMDDMLQMFWADGIKEMAVRTAAQAMTSYLKDTFELGRTAAMAPGSLADWPIQQQRPLFRLLGDVTAAVGVKLSSTCLMIPAKSVSGILFPTESRFESCQLCPRPTCPGRRAPYDKDLYDRRYSLKQ